MKLEWRRTWPDVPADFVAYDETSQQIGRVFRTLKPQGGTEWQWAGCGRYKGWTLSDAGRCETRQEAVDALKQAWMAMVERRDRAD